MKKTYRTGLFLISFFVFAASFSFADSGRRKHFLSHGPSVTAFAAGETVFSAYRDAAVMQYNPSLMAYFSQNIINFSRFNLYEDTGYNSGSFVLSYMKNLRIGVSVSNVSSGGFELRDDILSSARDASINYWNYVVSGAGMIKPLGLAYGINMKYVYYDLYEKSGGTFAADFGLAKIFGGPKILGNVSKIKLGLSGSNIVSGDLKLDEEKEDIPQIYRLSTAFVVPVYYRFQSQDTVSIFADIKYEDDFCDLYGGLAYTLADKYSVKAGYYPQHFTFGFGVDLYSFTVDYAADFSELDMVNRFGLSYKWGVKRTNELAKEAKAALDKERLTLKEAEERFNEAKKLYNKGRYLRATDMLSEIVVSYPNFESPLHFYRKISDNMLQTAEGASELDFSKLTYAKGYCAYYHTDFQTALNEWGKYVQFAGENEEIAEYADRINNAIKLEKLKQYEADTDAKAGKILKEGIAKFNEGQWVECIKTMENLQNFVSRNNFSKTIEYYSKAKEYIAKAVIELSKSIKAERKEIGAKEPEPVKEEKSEIDTASADKKYNEGLILYAQGKYFEAERIWELTLRLNPAHQKAKIALSKLRESGRLAQ